MRKLNAKEYKRFKDVKLPAQTLTNTDGLGQLAPILDCNKLENFQKNIERTMLAYKNSGFGALIIILTSG